MSCFDGAFEEDFREEESDLEKDLEDDLEDEDLRTRSFLSMVFLIYDSELVTKSNLEFRWLALSTAITNICDFLK